MRLIIIIFLFIFSVPSLPSGSLREILIFEDLPLWSSVTLGQGDQQLIDANEKLEEETGKHKGMKSSIWGFKIILGSLIL